MFWFFILAVHSFAADIHEDPSKDCVLHTFKAPLGKQSFCWFMGHPNPLSIDCHKLPKGMCIIYQNTEKACDPSFDWSECFGFDFTFPFSKDVNAVVTYKNSFGDCYKPAKMTSTLVPTANDGENVVLSYHSCLSNGSNTHAFPPVCKGFYSCSQTAQIEQKFVRKDGGVVCQFPDSKQQHNVTITPLSSFNFIVLWNILGSPRYTVSFPDDRATLLPSG